MVFDSTLADELAAVRKHLERERELRKKAEEPLERALELLENCCNAIASNDRMVAEGVGAAGREFLDSLKE